MSLARKMIFAIIWSILFVAIFNVVSIYIFYTTYLKAYLYEKNNIKENITIDYINEVIKKQTIDNIDSIFSDSEIEFFELLETNDWKIPLNKEKNVNIVINYLVKSWLAPKYIEEIIPTNNLEKVLDDLKDEKSPESKFFSRFSYSILIVNIVILSLIFILLFFFVRKTIKPINKTTEDIRNLNENLKKSGKNLSYNIEYKNSNDEIWLLVKAINSLNIRLWLQNKIKTRLLADISHELKTPITSIQCYLEWISDWVIKLNGKNLKAISSEMNRLISLVNKIMDYEKFDRKNFSLNISKFNVSDLLKSLSETHKKRLSENKQRIKITWEDSLELEADKDLFTQLSHNLIWNFLKYAGKKSQLNVNITKKYIDFNDNWKWIKSSQIPFLTEKFYQWDIEKTWDVEVRWIWVWLSMVEKIIESHNWKYEIKTELKKGFSFKIYIS